MLELSVQVSVWVSQMGICKRLHWWSGKVRFYTYRVGQKKTDHFLKCITFLYNDIGRHSIYQNVQLFIGSKNNILNAAVFKYSLYKVRETILH